MSHQAIWMFIYNAKQNSRGSFISLGNSWTRPTPQVGLMSLYSSCAVFRLRILPRYIPLWSIRLSMGICELAVLFHFSRQLYWPSLSHFIVQYRTRTEHHADITWNGIFVTAKFENSSLEPSTSKNENRRRKNRRRRYRNNTISYSTILDF